jgi:Tetratricopeptide repeat
MSEAPDRLIRWTELRDLLAPRVQQAVTRRWATLDLAETLERLGETPKAISLLSNADSEYPSSRAVHFRLLHLYRSSGEMPIASAEAKWFKSQPG